MELGPNPCWYADFDRHTRIYADLAHIDWSRILSSQYPSSPSLVAAYGSLKGALAAPNTDFLSYATRLTDAILRALDTIHLFLFSPPNLGPDVQTQTVLGAPLRPNPKHIDSARIALTSPLLMYVLRTALHILVRTAHDSTKSKRPRQRPHTSTPASTDAHARVDKVLDHLLECVLLTLLRALVPLCFARLAPLLPASLKKDKDKVGRAVGKGKDKDKGTCTASADPPKKTDVRTDVFAIIGMSLEALDALPPLVRPDASGAGSIAGGIRDRLGLEVIRELEALYAAPPPPSSLQPSSQQPQATPSEPPLPTPTPTPTPLSAQLQPHPQLQPRTQQRLATDSRAKRLEKLAGTRAERVRALATRDAGWFLASTLNLCVTPAGRHASGAPHDPTASNDNTGRLLREALLDRIGKLVRSATVPFDLGGHDGWDGTAQQPSDPSEALYDRNAVDSKFSIDPVCQNMLLAICERAMSDLASS